VGGLGLNAIESSKQVEEFIASLDKIAQLAKQPNYPITVHLTTHPFSNGLTEIREKAMDQSVPRPLPTMWITPPEVICSSLRHSQPIG
jgi:metallo-beta-lactamase class B